MKINMREAIRHAFPDYEVEYEQFGEHYRGCLRKESFAVYFSSKNPETLIEELRGYVVRTLHPANTSRKGSLQ